MPMVKELSRRVDGVEYAVDRMIERLEILAEDSAEQAQESREQMAQFRQEMAEFRDRMDASDRKFKEQMDASDREFKQRMDASDREFRERMDKFYEEQRQHRREMGQLSNKMGTLVEDLIAPSIPRILREVINCEEKPSMFSVRMVKHVDGRTQEYDAVAVCGDYLLINETKSRLKSEDIPKFQNMLYEARMFLPEYGDKKIIGALATFYVDPSLVVKGEREGLIMLGAADGIIELLNQDHFVPRLY